MVKLFDGNDRDYQAWAAAQSNGFVLNVRRSLSPTYMVLHRVSCRTIRSYHPTAPLGAFTERGYVKVCANDLADLRNWVKKHGRPDGSFSKVCGLCN